MLKKSNEELLMDDNGEGCGHYPDSWGLLADKGYQGAASMLRCTHPKNKQRNVELTLDELVRNGNVSSDRVLVENVFGRTCMLWKKTHSKFKWSESTFDTFTGTCLALTNIHVDVNPLRARFYKTVMGRYASIADRERTRRALTQRRYRRKREAQTAADMSFSSPSQLVGYHIPSYRV
ncbi:hypothetical protein PF005_g2050 [Phytophthora fragariae]|uniref:DDE Tnp4 domain-containing protein n=1 Tax=Phytophthora fragariae TaxID=53985 RepID=A0A6A3UVH2_9STRA|nr:hypothetical protein PF003_g2437 [Phytophthora fragariae]KAE9136774.1 hypothetical protein PF007_g2066 [Phytophthora fragariae]KAE9154328.1 hypothetical protein PF006_g1641 [Phytophthora fragariae]KAE9234089.1 hypothetical protein PF005_g2050 [Phytophthora fragariae]KAE9255518.1 hypothetical protein PF002_g2316 [Phytophthora fragariae]